MKSSIIFLCVIASAALHASAPTGSTDKQGNKRQKTDSGYQELAASAQQSDQSFSSSSTSHQAEVFQGQHYRKEKAEERGIQQSAVWRNVPLPAYVKNRSDADRSMVENKIRSEFPGLTENQIYLMTSMQMVKSEGLLSRAHIHHESSSSSTSSQAEVVQGIHRSSTEAEMRASHPGATSNQIAMMMHMDTLPRELLSNRYMSYESSGPENREQPDTMRTESPLPPLRDPYAYFDYLRSLPGDLLNPANAQLE